MGRFASSIIVFWIVVMVSMTTIGCETDQEVRSNFSIPPSQSSANDIVESDTDWSDVIEGMEDVNQGDAEE